MLAEARCVELIVMAVAYDTEARKRLRDRGTSIGYRLPVVDCDRPEDEGCAVPHGGTLAAYSAEVFRLDVRDRAME